MDLHMEQQQQRNDRLNRGKQRRVGLNRDMGRHHEKDARLRVLGEKEVKNSLLLLLLLVTTIVHTYKMMREKRITRNSHVYVNFV